MPIISIEELIQGLEYTVQKDLSGLGWLGSSYKSIASSLIDALKSKQHVEIILFFEQFSALVTDTKNKGLIIALYPEPKNFLLYIQNLTIFIADLISDLDHIPAEQSMLFGSVLFKASQFILRRHDLASFTHAIKKIRYALLNIVCSDTELLMELFGNSENLIIVAASFSEQDFRRVFIAVLSSPEVVRKLQGENICDALQKYVSNHACELGERRSNLLIECSFIFMVRHTFNVMLLDLNLALNDHPDFATPIAQVRDGIGKIMEEMLQVTPKTFLIVKECWHKYTLMLQLDPYCKISADNFLTVAGRYIQELSGKESLQDPLIYLTIIIHNQNNNIINADGLNRILGEIIDSIEPKMHDSVITLLQTRATMILPCMIVRLICAVSPLSEIDLQSIISLLKQKSVKDQLDIYINLANNLDNLSQKFICYKKVLMFLDDVIPKVSNIHKITQEQLDLLSVLQKVGAMLVHNPDEISTIPKMKFDQKLGVSIVQKLKGISVCGLSNWNYLGCGVVEITLPKYLTYCLDGVDLKIDSGFVDKCLSYVFRYCGILFASIPNLSKIIIHLPFVEAKIPSKQNVVDAFVQELQSSSIFISALRKKIVQQCDSFIKQTHPGSAELTNTIQFIDHLLQSLSVLPEDSQLVLALLKKKQRFIKDSKVLAEAEASLILLKREMQNADTTAKLRALEVRLKTIEQLNSPCLDQTTQEICIMLFREIKTIVKKIKAFFSNSSPERYWVIIEDLKKSAKSKLEQINVSYRQPLHSFFAIRDRAIILYSDFSKLSDEIVAGSVFNPNKIAKTDTLEKLSKEVIIVHAILRELEQKYEQKIAALKNILQQLDGCFMDVNSLESQVSGPLQFFSKHRKTNVATANSRFILDILTQVLFPEIEAGKLVIHSNCINFRVIDDSFMAELVAPAVMILAPIVDDAGYLLQILCVDSKSKFNFGFERGESRNKVTQAQGMVLFNIVQLVISRIGIRGMNLDIASLVTEAVVADTIALSVVPHS